MVTKSQYTRNQEIIRNRLAKLYVQQVYKALQEQIFAATAVIKERGVAGAVGHISELALNDKIGAVVLELYRTAANQAAKKYKPNIKGFGFDQAFINGVLQYLKNFLLNKVVAPITNTTVAFIDDLLQQAIRAGWGVDETVKRLEKSEITKARARTIVRTETVRATNYTQLAAADSEDFEMEKGWIAISDKRTRKAHSHAGVDGERQPLYEPYSNGLMFPGDPTGPANQIINCRCTQSFHAARDLSGNLIPKKNKGITITTALSMRHAA